jgi:hypothetical protein
MRAQIASLTQIGKGIEARLAVKRGSFREQELQKADRVRALFASLFFRVSLLRRLRWMQVKTAFETFQKTLKTPAAPAAPPKT